MIGPTRTFWLSKLRERRVILLLRWRLLESAHVFVEPKVMPGKSAPHAVH
jgi:hypothetical protein